MVIVKMVNPVFNCAWVYCELIKKPMNGEMTLLIIEEIPFYLHFDFTNS